MIVEYDQILFHNSKNRQRLPAKDGDALEVHYRPVRRHAGTGANRAFRNSMKPRLRADNPRTAGTSATMGASGAACEAVLKRPFSMMEIAG